MWCMMWVVLCSYCVAVQHTHPKAKGVTGTRADRQNVFLCVCFDVGMEWSINAVLGDTIQRLFGRNSTAVVV